MFRSGVRSVSLVVALLLALGSLSQAEPVTITGKVLGPDDRPVADAQVLLQYNEADSKMLTERAVTGGDGAFSFARDLIHLGRSVTLAARKPGLALDWRAITLDKQTTLTLGLAADPVTLIGTVKDPQGNPVAGAEAYIHSLRRGEQRPGPFSDVRGIFRTYFRPQDKSFLGATSDDAGRFEISGLPPDAHVSLTVLAGGRERWSTGWESLPATTQGLEVVLRAEATISGHITCEGEPVAGRTVFCTTRLIMVRTVESLRANVGLWAAKTVSSEDGTYKLAQLSPGTHYLRVDPPEGLTGPTIGPITLEPGETVADVDVALTPGGLVTGTITQADTGQPLAGIGVSVQRPDRSCHPQTDDDGIWVARLLPGQYEVSCSIGHDSVAVPVVEPQQRTVKVAEGKTIAGVDFVVYPLSIQGQVLLPDGDPAAGVDVGAIGVRYYDDSSRGPSMDYKDLFRAKTDEQGHFELKFKERRGFWISILACHFELGLAGMVAFEEDVLPDGPVEIRLTQGGYLLGDVVDTHGHPVPNMQVLINVWHGRRHQGTYSFPSDQHGRLMIGPLPPQVRLSVSPVGQARRFATDSAWDDVGSFTLVAGERYKLPPLVLKLQGRSLKGWVGDEQQRSVKGALVFVSRTEEPVHADDQGLFELTGLPSHGLLWIVAVHPTEPLFSVQRIDPDWGFEPGLILLPLGEIVGQVVDEQGDPVRAAKVMIYFSHGWDISSSKLLTRSPFRQGIWATETDEQGKWRIEGLIGGVDYQVNVRAAGHEDYRHPAAVTATGGETVDMGEIVLRK